MKYRLFGTTADVGVVSYGRDLVEAFENQAKGMFSIMADLRGVRKSSSFDVIAKARDVEGLLTAWLEELLFISDTKGVLLRRFDITVLKGQRLSARVYGEAVDPARHVIKTPVKAVTYHKLRVAIRPGSVTTRVVYDI
jgi:protein archease